MSASDRAPEKTDVLVLGAGPAGFAAALTAASAGSRTTVIEKRDELAGNAGYSSGYAAFSGTSLQRAQGIEDGPEQFLSDMLNESGRWKYVYPTCYHDAVAKVYAQRSGEVYERLHAVGLRVRAIIPRRHKHTVDRMHAIEDVRVLNGLFADVLRARSVDVRTRQAGTRLIMDQGRVVGARVTTPKGAREIHASRGVILATGGFQADSLLRQLYQPEPWCNVPCLGVAEDQGDGHRMAAAAGAQLINMSLLPPFPIVATALIEHAIAVNKNGLRFHDESDPFTTALENQEQPSQMSFYIFDAETARRYPHYIATLARRPESAPTLHELADKIGVDAQGLTRTVAEWNAALGMNPPRDPHFDRRALGGRAITEPPFHASAIRFGISVTYGGSQVNERMQVLNPFGEPIDGLYAVGNCAGNLAAVAELGGIHIGSAFTLGVVAGEAITR